MSISKSLHLIRQEFANKIIIDEDIENQPKGNRGIYGLFIKKAREEECAYIGRSEIVSSRIVSHLYKIIDGNSCFDCKIWAKKGYIPKHFAIYRYEENMKEYFSRYKFMGDYCLRKIFQQEI